MTLIGGPSSTILSTRPVSVHFVSLSERVLLLIPLNSFLISLNRLSPAMYSVARISMVHLELNIENASTEASTSQVMSISSS